MTDENLQSPRPNDSAENPSLNRAARAGKLTEDERLLATPKPEQTLFVLPGYLRRVTREQEGVLRLAAHRQGVTISEYIRQAATEAVRRVAA